MLRVKIKIPSNLGTYRTGFNCPNCGHELDKTLKGRKSCHKAKCPYCAENIMIHIKKS